MDSSYLVLCLLNAFLSYTATMLNIVTIHAIRKTPSLSKNLKTLLLSLAVSDLGVGFVVQPLYVALCIMESKLNIETSKTYNAILVNQDDSYQTKYSNDCTILFPSITTIRFSD